MASILMLIVFGFLVLINACINTASVEVQIRYISFCYEHCKCILAVLAFAREIYNRMNSSMFNKLFK